MRRYAFSMLKDEEQAKDAVQAIFMNCWEKWEQLDKSQSIKTYLFTGIYNYCLNIQRHEQVRQKHRETQSPAFHDTADKVVNKELGRQINQALEELPQQCRIIFNKSRFEEKKYAEIAAEMQLSVKTVEAQIGKALKYLRQKAVAERWFNQ